jgi:hypothetical protein
MEILKGRFGEGSHVVVSIRNGKIHFRAKNTKKSEAQVPVAAN